MMLQHPPLTTQRAATAAARVARRTSQLALAAAGLIFCAAVQAQGFPSRPILMTVGFAPSGGTDTAARIIARKLSDNLGQQVVVENKAGAGGNIAADHIAKATPDGHSISLAAMGPLVVAPHLVNKLPYDPRRDIAPITMGVVFPNVLVVNAALPVNTLAEFVKYANSSAGGAGYGTSGIGGTGHLAGELFRSLAKANVVHVPYKGGGPAMADLLGGQIPAAFASAPSALPQIKAGKIRALGITSPKRSTLTPGIPAIAESFPGYDATNWYAFVAPGRTPKELIDRLNRELIRAMNAPEVREQLVTHGMEPQPTTPEELARIIEREYQTWGKVVREANIQAQ